MTAKQIAGYLKARRDQRGSTFGGITFNDGYNVPTFGITKAAYDAISRAMHDEYGAFGEPTEPTNLTPAVVKKALSNHPIREHHATKKSPAKKSPAKVMSQSQMFYEAERKAADANKTFLDILPTLRRKELERLIAQRPALWGRFAGYLTSGHVFVDDPAAGPSKTSHATRKTSRHHATKKSPAQLEREIAEALSKSGKGHRPSKLGGDYFTVVLTRAKPESTNEWNRLPVGWDSQVRGTFPTKYAAYKWAREKLLPGAPFTIRYVPLGQ